MRSAVSGDRSVRSGPSPASPPHASALAGARDDGPAPRPGLSAVAQRRPWRDRPAGLGPMAAPRSPTEVYLRHLWEDALRIRAVGTDDDFFMLGGDSILAVALFAALERDLGARLPLSTLVRSPTIRALTPLIEAGVAPDGTLVPLRTSGSNPPLFCVHPYGIEVFAYRGLVAALGPDQPVYGLRADWAASGTAPATLAAMAGGYVEAIRSRQPHGPYHLAGICLGGTIAFEAAQLLHAAGEPIALVAMADAECINPYGLARRAWLHLRHALPRLGRGGGRHLLALARRRLGGESPVRRRPPPDPPASSSPAHDFFARAITAAMVGYRPAPCRFPLLLAISEEYAASDWSNSIYGQTSLGWETVARSGIEVIDTPGTHAELFVSPHVERLAERIAAAVKRSMSG